MMDPTTSRQSERAEAFAGLHRGQRLLVMPNAWDAVTARLYETEGFSAIGTTSAGIAASLGYPDGEKMPLADHLVACRRIIAAVRIPVSVDLEAGYAGSLEGLRESVAAAIECGASGINLEDSPRAGCGVRGADGLVGMDEQCARIAAAREAADRVGVPIVINARIDVYLGKSVAAAERVAVAIERGNAYRRAGADCVFVPDMGSMDERDIEILAREIAAPLNIIAGPRTPPVARLEELGVARLSFGPRPMRAALGFLRDMAREWRTSGTFTRLATASTLSYDEVSGWFVRS